MSQSDLVAAVSPSVTVIIRTKNESRYLRDVIQALHSQHYAGAIDVIVVDSGSTDATVEIAMNCGARVITMPPEQFSFGRALNWGAKAATGEWLVNLSGHAIPATPSYLSNLVAPLSDSNVWATFGRDAPLPGCGPSQARDITEWFPNAQVDRSRYFSNANACLRRSAWEEVPFDETLTGAEDAKWAREVLGKGRGVVYVPTAVAYHSHSSSPLVIYNRAVRERRALASFDPARGRFSLMAAVRFAASTTRLDLRYAWRMRASPLWWLHIPLYRAAQGFGLYRGSWLAGSRVEAAEELGKTI